MELFLQFAINSNTIRKLTLQYDYQNLVEELSESPGTKYAGFTDPDALIIAHSDDTRIGSNDKGISIYEIIAPVEIDENYLGTVKIAFSMKDAYKAIFKNISIIVIIGLASFLILAALLIKISQGILKSLENTNTSLSTLVLGDFT